MILDTKQFAALPHVLTIYEIKILFTYLRVPLRVHNKKDNSPFFFMAGVAKTSVLSVNCAGLYIRVTIMTISKDPRNILREL